MKLVESGPQGPRATIPEIAAIEFAAVKQLRRLSKRARLKKAHEIVGRVRPMVLLAGEIMAADKAQLISMVEEAYDEFGPALMLLANARTDARALVEIIRAAEVRTRRRAG